ncbi:SHOCT domain-containing protein, partial [Oenococcus oeni]
IVRRLVAAIGLFVLAAYYLYVSIASIPYAIDVINSYNEYKTTAGSGQFWDSYLSFIFMIIIPLGIGITYLIYSDKHLTKNVEWIVVIVAGLMMLAFSIFTSAKNVDGYILMGLVILGLSFDQSKKEKKVETKQTSEPKDNNLSQLVELKKLLDSGVITKEEFKAKKKQILGL